MKPKDVRKNTIEYSKGCPIGAELEKLGRDTCPLKRDCLRKNKKTCKYSNFKLERRQK